MEGSQNYKSRSRYEGHAPSDLLLHFWFAVFSIHLRIKFEVPSYTRSRDIEEVPKL